MQDATELVVGNEDCRYEVVVQVIAENPSAAVLLNNWTSLCRKLELPFIEQEILRKKLLQEKINHIDVLQEILILWRSRRAGQAKLQDLLTRFEELGWIDISGSLRKKFKLYTYDECTKWMDLDIQTRSILMHRNVKFMGALRSLVSIMDTLELDPSCWDAFIDKYVKSSFMKQLDLNKVPILVDNRIPEVPSYYVSRKIRHNCFINSIILKEESHNDIFLFQNIEWNQLSNLVNGHLTERSGNVLNELPTVQFIILEKYAHFKVISKNVCNFRNIHLVEVQTNGRLKWLETCGSVKLIIDFLDKTNAEVYDETKFLDEFSQKNKNSVQGSKTVCVSDSPGMGKTLLLAKMANLVQTQNDHSYAIFISLREFIHLELSLHDLSNRDSMIQSIVRYLSPLEIFGKQLLLACLTSAQSDVHIFLDGFDEILANQVELAHKFLECITHLFPDFMIYVSTRHHMRQELQETLHTLAYEIVPFDEREQQNFLLSYWQNQCKLSLGKSLTEFSELVIAEIKKIDVKSNDFERSIASIPLQCFMLAQIFAEQAKIHCDGQNMFETVLSFNSVFDIYEALMDHKLVRVQQIIQNKDKTENILNKLFNRAFGKIDVSVEVINAHMYLALKLLFPEWSEKFRKILIKKNSIEFSNIYLVGIMEKYSETEDKLPRFVHRTYAEFFVAKFVFNAYGFKEWNVGRIDLENMNKFLFEYVLQTSLEDDRALPSDAYIYVNMFNTRFLKNSFVYVAVCYFLNEHLKAKDTHLNNSHNLECFVTNINILVQSMPLFVVPVHSILRGSIYQNLIRLFKVFTQLYFLNWADNPVCALTDEDSRSMLLMAAKYASRDCFIKCCDLVYRITKKSWLALNPVSEHHLFQGSVTALHVACIRGHYPIVEYIIRNLPDRITSLKYLLESVLSNSLKTSTEILAEKKQILSLLINTDKQILSDFNLELLGCSHISLLECIIRLGIDFSTFSRQIYEDSKKWGQLPIITQFQPFFESFIRVKLESSENFMHVYKQHVAFAIKQLCKQHNIDVDTISTVVPEVVDLHLDAENLSSFGLIKLIRENLECEQSNFFVHDFVGDLLAVKHFRELIKSFTSSSVHPNFDFFDLLQKLLEAEETIIHPFQNIDFCSMKSVTIKRISFKNNVLAFFLDGYLHDFASASIDQISWLNSILRKSAAYNAKVFHRLISCTVIADYKYLYDFIIKIFIFQGNYGDEFISSVREKNLRWTDCIAYELLYGPRVLTKSCFNLVEMIVGKPLVTNTLCTTEIASELFYITPLHLAVISSDFFTVKDILNTCNVHIKHSKYLLHVCVNNSTKDAFCKIESKCLYIQKLVHISENLLEEHECVDGCTPILVNGVHIRLLEMLISLNANVYATSMRDGFTVIHKAAQYLQPADFDKFVRLLVKKGHRKIFQMLSRTKTTAVHEVLLYINVLPDTLKFLLDHQDDSEPIYKVDNEDIEGKTELFYAVAGHQNQKILELLVSYGSNPRKIDCNNKNILDAAAQFGHKDAGDFLQKFFNDKF